MMKHIAICLIAALLILLCSISSAEQKAYKLEPKTVPELEHGKIIMLEGTADAEGHRFFLEDLSILQPISVTLLSQDRGHDLRLILSKYRYDESEKEGSTKGKKRLTLKTRTQGEMKIQVKSPDASHPYQLVVWAGDEIKPEMPPVVVAMDKYKKTQKKESATGESGRPVMWVIALLLGGIVILLGMMVLKGKKE